MWQKMYVVVCAEFRTMGFVAKPYGHVGPTGVYKKKLETFGSCHLERGDVRGSWPTYAGP
jgi:hypothetical protein